MTKQAILPGFAKSIKTSVGKYLLAFPDEAKRLRGLSVLIEKIKSEEQLYSRKNFIGHITASGLVLSPDRKKILFLKHKYLDRFLQPGGHVEETDDTIFATATREIHEETGLKSPTYIPFHLDYYLPIDIDTHDIPANEDKNEPKHVHHDFRFLFCVDSEADFKAAKALEGGELVWTDLDQAATQSTFKLVVQKIRIALSQEFLPRRFFRCVANVAQYKQRCSSVVVTHLLPDVLSYLEMLSAVTYVQAVIPKPKSIVTQIKADLEKQFPLVDLRREEIAGNERLLKIFDDLKGDFILFDIGGYFATSANTLAVRYKQRFLGIIEDTENGHQKYEDAHRNEALQVPVISVARSPLKENEDFLVGQSVLFSADAVLRECGLLMQYMSCAVLGFGKIGRSIAHHLLMRGVKPAVFDINPIRRVQANNLQCETPEKMELLRHADILFSATGSHSMDLLDFRNLKSGCFVFSVTSSEDEFDTTFLEADYQEEKVSQHVWRYSRHDHHFYLVNQGNAVNFIHKAVLGSFIHLVRAEMIFAGACLIRHEFKNGIGCLSPEQRKIISQAWLDTFNASRHLATHFEIRDKTSAAGFFESR